ncbi:hypothetical protein MSAN_01231700 [Mycena sanguinolenta]|uniref:Uncharacterized protein n=1 Tax=Mycena sanguinolenta TaxID=230812 RepID=A0A8H6YFU4_9AGAR|nr:hypothetical protein MSAN_01231700 [Mycena sanguinolenta]
MANDPVFPPELFVAIIDQLADDLETLRSGSLVSRSFHSLADVCSRLEVGPRDDQEHNIAQLCELLESSPLFAARVRSLCVYERYESLVSDADLGSCLHLISLTRLSIEIESQCNPRWLGISVANRDSIQATLPTLTCLELRGIEELPLTLLGQCSSLRSLTLKWVTFTENLEQGVGPYTSALIQLQSLSLELHLGLDQFVRWIMRRESPVDFSCLHTLECAVFHSSVNDHVLIQQLLDASALSLHCLSIRHHFNLYGFLDLRKLIHLQTLSVIVSSRPTRHMLSLNSFVFSPQPPRALALELDITHDDSERTQVIQDLPDVDRALVTLPFKTVIITFYLWDWNDVETGGRKNASMFPNSFCR